MYTHKMVDGEAVPLTAAEIAELEARDAAWLSGQGERDRQARNAEIMAQISELDRFIPRGLEDLIDVLAVDVTTLPQVQQDRLTQKKALRAQLVF
jgi:hypothetical protein